MAFGEDNAPRFRAKVTFMKTWKPASQPSNRDRLELYALHKQAISGDAPSTMTSVVMNSAPEKAKYQAWKLKQGTPAQEAMEQYVRESDRQIRVYGTASSGGAVVSVGNNDNNATTTTIISQNQNVNGNQLAQSKQDPSGKSSNPQTPLNTPNASEASNAIDGNGAAGGGGNGGTNVNSGSNNSGNNGAAGGAAGGSGSSANQSVPTATSRGLAAIPLLCAAAGESRPGYIRRLGQTPSVDHGWWKRQEVLCSSQGSIMAIPESILLFVARLVEFISLAGQEEILKRQRWQQQERTRQQQSALVQSSATSGTATRANPRPPGPSLPVQLLMIFPSPIVQAFLWPVHNCLLSLWMAIILVISLVSGAWRCLQTLIWGARRTGIALRTVWQSEIQDATQAIHSLCQPYQAISCRLVGLVLLPISTIVGIFRGILGDSSVTLTSMGFTMVMMATWWYWTICLPWLALCMLGAALASGTCFALIEFAGV